jgi:hypothetical protein
MVKIISLLKNLVSVIFQYSFVPINIERYAKNLFFPITVINYTGLVF